MTVKIAYDTKDSEIFEGACVDSDVRLSVIGEPQADLCCQTFEGIIKVTSSQTSYRFGDNS